MRPVRAMALVLVMGTLAACGRSGDDGSFSDFRPGVFTERPAPIYRSPPEFKADQPIRRQPPLASLLDKPNEEKPAKPLRRKPTLAPRADPAPKRTAKKDVPERDVVDLGLQDEKLRTPPSKPRSNESPKALRVAARPTPKPVIATPRPVSRPTASDVPVVSEISVPAPAPTVPRPSISALPTLGAPRVVADATPSAVPDPSRAEAAIPIGRVPASLGAANIEARETALPVADSLERSSAGDSGGIGWDEAAALMRAGEVADAIDVGEYEVLMTLCSGRGVLTIQPEPGALAAVKTPEVICGKSSSLTSP